MAREMPQPGGEGLQGLASTTTAMAYDLQHRLHATSVQDSVHGASSTTETYDAVGNVVQEVAFRTQNYSYDADNELTYTASTEGYHIAYEYDRNGNQVVSDLVYQDNRTERGTTSYDYENRVVVDGGCAYTYTPSGDRASDSCNGGAPYERNDAAAPPSASNLIVQYNATGTREERYVSAGTDRPVELVSGSSKYWYASDGLGSVKRLTDASGATADTYAYDVWGLATSSGNVSNPLEFAARPLDSSGLYDLRARSYDPTVNGGHRFTSADPAGGGYAYVGDSPANYVDPSGMRFTDSDPYVNVYSSKGGTGDVGGGGGVQTSSSLQSGPNHDKCQFLLAGIVLDVVSGLIFGIPFAFVFPAAASIAWQVASQGLAMIEVGALMGDWMSVAGQIISLAAAIILAIIPTLSWLEGMAMLAKSITIAASIILAFSFLMIDLAAYFHAGC